VLFLYKKNMAVGRLESFEGLCSLGM